MAIITSVKERINQLNQASFQILCDALLAREGYPGIVALGTKDGAEKTTPGTPDTYFCLSGGKYVFAEYTTQKTGLSTQESLYAKSLKLYIVTHPQTSALPMIES